jgi:fructose-1,6-bisphosphatase/inositol monophosphatase family enzyme
LIRRRIEQQYPAHAIVGEEFGHPRQRGRHPPLVH